MAIRFSCGSTKQEAAPKANTEKCYGFALEITNLQSFSAGTRIATSHRRCKVRLIPFPPSGENCTRFLAPPLPAKRSFAGAPWLPRSSQ